MQPFRLSFTEKYAALLKIVSIGILILLFLIPAGMITRLINEREEYQRTVANEVAYSWGNQQRLAGPVISVPYWGKIDNGNRSYRMVKMYLHILPENIKINANLDSKKLHRSIYDIAVYKSQIEFNGNFTIDPASLDQMNPSDLLWNEAVCWMEISDLKGVKEKINITIDNRSYFFEPGLKTRTLAESGVSFLLPLQPLREIKSLPFECRIELNGSQRLDFFPLGKLTEVNLTSNWADPSFQGAFSPEDREILPDNKGCKASWKVLHLNRNFPQVFREADHSYQNFAFGVELLQPVDHYQKSMRSVKYAIMFITLTFLVFFFTEIIHQRSIHPIQYIMIGLALVVFFTLLISLAEHIGFDWSYLIAAISIISLITIYTQAVLSSKKLTLFMSGVLTILYGFIYTIIQLEDYALLFGSIGLFLFLAVMMIASRKIDWYKIRVRENAEE